MKLFRLDVEKKKMLYRALLVLAVFFGISLVQTGFLPFLHLWGTPDLIMGEVVAFALIMGLTSGGFAGLSGGVMLSFFGGSPADILFYTVLGFLIGFFGGGYAQRKFPSFAAFWGGSCVLKMLYALVQVKISSSAARLGAAFGATVFPGVAVTFICGLLLYVPLCLLPRRLMRGEKGGVL